MPDYAQIGHFYYQASNLTVGIGMLSLAAAIILGVCRKTTQYRWLSIGMSGLFIAAGVGRLLRAFQVLGNPELVADMVAALFALATGVMVWPILRKSLTLPKYEELAEMRDELQETNQKLATSNDLFRNFMDAIPLVAYLRNDTGQIIFINRFWEKFTGHPASDVIGKSSPDWHSSDIQKRRVQADLEVIHNRQWKESIEELPGPDGNIERFLMIRFPVDCGAQGTLMGGVCVDLTMQTELAQAKSQLSAIVESSQDAIIGKDLEGNITSWNKGAEELYGYSAKEVIGKSITMLSPSDRRDEIPAILDKIKRGVRVTDYETVRVCKDGREKDVLISVSPILNDSGAPVGAAVNARDITLLKKTQAEVNELNKQLKERVYELAEQTAALQAARDQALEASNLKSAFCANISHELRTPLSGILGLNEMLLQSKKLDDDQLQLAHMVQESAEALLNVVNDILDLTKIESGKVTLEYAPFNPVFLLQDCTKLMAPTAHQKHLKYELVIDQQMPEMVYGDVSRVRQVLLNLIGNAIKFTEKGSVQVRADVHKASADQVEIEFSVKDSGIGIADEDIRFLFMPFAQVDNSATRRFGGTGLGLAISKRFVDMMDGEINVVSQKGTGSTFSFRLTLDRRKLHEPIDPSSDRVLKPAVEPVPSELAVGRRILVVEDNAVLQNLALRQLATLGLQAEATVFGREAVELAMSDRFDMVLMDINLPDMTGLEATAAIRNMEHSASRAEIPIIAMTAGAMRGDRERALASGMNDYLAKPVAIENLKRTVELWLKKSRVRQYMNS